MAGILVCWAITLLLGCLLADEMGYGRGIRHVVTGKIKVSRDVRQ